MKKLNRIIVVIEVLLIVLMSLIAAYSLFGGDIRSLMLAFVLIVAGVLTIVWKNWHPGIFSGAALIAALPSLLRHNSTDLIGTSNNPNFHGINTTLIEAFGLGLVIILGYLMLKSLNAIQIEHKELIDGQAEKDEINNVTYEKLIVVSILVFFSGVISIPVILLSNWLINGVSNFLSSFTGNIIAIGLGIMLLLAASLYWLGRTLKS